VLSAAPPSTPGLAGRSACYYVPGVADDADDVACVEEMARGSQEALGRLYDAHAPLLSSLIQRIVGDTDTAEDLVHDVFLEAWRRAADYDASRGSVRTWLALRARSRALDHLKSAGVARRVSVAEPREWERILGTGEPGVPAPDRARVRSALVALPEDQQHVLFLGYFQGLSSSEIAEHVGIPVGTVKSRVATALGRLRQIFRDGKDEP